MCANLYPFVSSDRSYSINTSKNQFGRSDTITDEEKPFVYYKNNHASQCKCFMLSLSEQKWLPNNLLVFCVTQKFWNEFFYIVRHFVDCIVFNSCENIPMANSINFNRTNVRNIFHFSANSTINLMSYLMVKFLLTNISTELLN